MRLSSVWRLTVCALVTSLICVAQSDAPRSDLLIPLERQVRAMFSVPATVKIKMGEFQPSQFPGYDAITVTFDDPSNKRSLEFLVARDGKTIMRVFHLDLNADPYADVMKKIDLTGRPTRGANDAKVIAVNYDDFQCPFCARMHATLFPTLQKEYGDRIKFVYKDFPLEDIHPWALHAAANANCLAAQNTDAYWDFADYVHSNQKEVNTLKVLKLQYAALDRLATSSGKKYGLDATQLQACVKAQDVTAIRASQKEGRELGITATPEMFVNGHKVDGALPIDELRTAFDHALRDAGVAPPEHPAASN